MITVLKEISALKARQNLGELLERTYYNSEHFLIKRRDKAMAVLVPVDIYETWQAEREEDFKVFDEIRAKNRGVSAEQVERDLEAVTKKLRSERRATRK
ncbi:MAG: type II toxin-antitoxin system Phd/YefM family antitoxin [Candidatus Bipolaricaulia bacterium]